MKIKVLATGSSGNAYLISDGSTTLLLDAGLPFNDLQNAARYKLYMVDACLLSHSHQDHSKAAAGLLKYGIDIYTSQGTIDEIKLPCKRAEPLKQFRVKTMKILPFDVEHDAPEPLGFLITSTITGEKLLYATDTYFIKYRFNNLTHMVIECNYDKPTIKANIENGRTEHDLAQRVYKSHMGLDTLLEFLRANDLRKLRQVYVVHLSGTNSNAERIKRAVQAATGAEVYIGGDLITWQTTKNITI